MYRDHLKGFSLLECLTALSILAFSCLGLAHLHVNIFHEFSASQQRTQAIALAVDMGERIRANAKGAHAGYYNQLSTEKLQTPAAKCANVSCSMGDLAAYDIATWRERFNDLATQTGSTLSGGVGVVTGDGRNFNVTVVWDSNNSGATGTGCSDKSVDLDCFSIKTSL